MHATAFAAENRRHTRKSSRARTKAGVKPEMLAAAGKDIVVLTFTLAAAARCLEHDGPGFSAEDEARRFAKAFGLQGSDASLLAARMEAARNEKLPAIYFTSRLRMLCSGPGNDPDFLADMAARLLAYIDDGARPFNSPRFALAAAALPALGHEAAVNGTCRHFDKLGLRARELAASAAKGGVHAEGARPPLLRLMKRLHPDMYAAAPAPTLFAPCVHQLYEETRMAFETLRAAKKRKRFRLPSWFSGGKRKTMVPLSDHE